MPTSGDAASTRPGGSSPTEAGLLIWQVLWTDSFPTEGRGRKRPGREILEPGGNFPPQSTKSERCIQPAIPSIQTLCTEISIISEGSDIWLATCTGNMGTSLFRKKSVELFYIRVSNEYSIYTGTHSHWRFVERRLLWDTFSGCLGSLVP